MGCLSNEVRQVEPTRSSKAVFKHSLLISTWATTKIIEAGVCQSAVLKIMGAHLALISISGEANIQVILRVADLPPLSFLMLKELLHLLKRQLSNQQMTKKSLAHQA